MSVLLWILLFGLLMSCIALVGGLTLILREDLWRAIILPLVAFAAGSLLGGATFVMMPAAVEKMGNHTVVYLWLNAGFLLFYGLEEFLHWHHSHTHVHGIHESTLHHQHPSLPLNLHQCGDTCRKTTDPCPISSHETSASTRPDIVMEIECTQARS